MLHFVTGPVLCQFDLKGGCALECDTLMFEPSFWIASAIHRGFKTKLPARLEAVGIKPGLLCGRSARCMSTLATLKTGDWCPFLLPHMKAMFHLEVGIII